jgi:hypothetical protein
MSKRLAGLVEAANVLARSVFDELDTELAPEVLLVSLPGVQDTGARVHDVRRGESVVELDLASCEGDPGAIRRQVVDALRRESPGAATFVARARFVEDRPVLAALRLSDPVYGSYHALKGPSMQGAPRLARSLLEATVTTFLAAVADALADPAAAQRPLSFSHSPDEILRAAGRVLMQTPATMAGTLAAAPAFFQTCHRISAMPYEGREGSGRLLVAAAGHPAVHVDLAFPTRIDLGDHRAVRKVLEMTGEGLAMVSDSTHVAGLGRVVEGYDRSAEDLYEVRFRGHATWELCHADSILMRVADGAPRLPQWDLDEDEFRRLLGEVFASSRVDVLWRIAIEAARQHRGTMVVISAEAEAEAARLGPQALRLVPVPLTPERIPLLTAIDGALLVDTDGYCHAVGVILDGRASRRGDPARGARFNSAVRYVDASDHPAVAIVISEEGGVDLIRPLA